MTLVAVVPDPHDAVRVLRIPSFPLFGNGQECLTHGAREENREPIRWFVAVRRIYRYVGTLDGIVFTGGGLLDDFWGGAWRVPFFVLIWTLSARLRGKKVLFQAVGFDRLASPLSRTMAIASLNLADSLSFRDADSRRFLVAMGLRREGRVVPDLAFGLESTAGLALRQQRIEQASYVVVMPVSEQMWSNERHPAYELYIESFVSLCRWLLEIGVRVELLSTQPSMERETLGRVAAELGAANDGRCAVHHVESLEDFLDHAGGARLVVASRLHGLILSMVVGTPIVSVAPMRKMNRVMQDSGFGEFNLDIANINPGALIQMVSTAIEQEERLRVRVREMADAFRMQVEKEFDVVLDVLRRSDPVDEC
jgi:polysaccharide pyruvyl transferase WcaK-like protein